jgi:methylated-DNA-[protein]-cysteine S-methyltransferase
VVPEGMRALVFEVAPPGAARWGWLGLISSADGLRALMLPATKPEVIVRRIQRAYGRLLVEPGNRFLDDVAQQVTAYLSGERREFSIGFDRSGYNDFELAVWRATERIPYGETRTYGWVASQVGAGSGAAQAVGAILGSNPLPLVVPCHRVIAADGSLHGYGGGLDLKARLLALESRQLSLGLEDFG